MPLPERFTCNLGKLTQATWTTTGKDNSVNTLGVFQFDPNTKAELTINGPANIAYAVKLSVGLPTDLVPWQAAQTGPKYFSIPKGTTAIEIDFTNLDSGTPVASIRVTNG